MEADPNRELAYWCFYEPYRLHEADVKRLGDNPEGPGRLFDALRASAMRRLEKRLRDSGVTKPMDEIVIEVWGPFDLRPDGVQADEYTLATEPLPAYGPPKPAPPTTEQDPQD